MIFPEHVLFMFYFMGVWETDTLISADYCRLCLYLRGARDLVPHSAVLNFMSNQKR